MPLFPTGDNGPINTYPQIVNLDGSELVEVSNKGTGKLYTKISTIASYTNVATITFANIADATAANIPSTTNVINTAYRTAVGDFGGAHYKKVVSAPSHNLKFQSADGAWWEIYEPRPTPEMAGALGNGIADDSLAFTNLLAVYNTVYCTAGRTYAIKDIVLNGKEVIGNGATFKDYVGSRWLFKLTGYKPGLFNIVVNDQGNYVNSTTIAAPALSGVSSLTLTSGAGVAINNVALYQGNGTLWNVTLVTNVVGNVVTFLDATSEAVSAGGAFYSFESLLVVEDAQFFAIENVLSVNTRSLLAFKPSTASATLGKGSVRNLESDGIVYTGILKFGNSHDITMSDIQLWGGITSSYSYVGAGVAGAFGIGWPIYQISDVTVTVGGVTKTYGVDWTFADAYTITFLVGHYPGAGVPVNIAHFHDCMRLFVDDQTGSFVAGGNQYSNIKMLDGLVGFEFRGAGLTDLTQCFADTISQVSLLLNGGVQSLRFFGCGFMWALRPIYAYNIANPVISGAQITRVNNAYLPSISSPNPNPTIYVDTGTTLDIDTSSINGEAPVVTGAGLVKWRGAEYWHVGSGSSTVAQNSIVYLTSAGQMAAINQMQYVAASTLYILELNVASDNAPGVGQSYTYDLLDNSTVVGTVTVSGNASFGGSIRLTAYIVKDDRIQLRLTTSATATAANHRAWFVMR